MGERLVCIHGHFYQPPRENPWLQAVELEDSAWPFHDWNERITAECYAPNASSRILDGDGRIVRIADNYQRISFNFGPTLLSWLSERRPDVHQAIVEADRAGRERFGGHGPAMAQAYNHAILPLCNDRDRRTQVRWGLADFRHRFGREAEGMWLPEAAADVASLEALAAEGVKFTVLAPRQARRVRPPGRGWHATNGIDPRRAYRCKLPSGRTIALFFYDGIVSQAVAFERLLESGERLAERMVGTFDGREEPQLAHIATDGETYGHHFARGDMALAYALHRVEEMGARLTIYAEHLARFPPTWDVEIHDNSSWSCAHGIERWRSDCGCNSGREGWGQHWREPLRNALDWLRDEVAPCYEHAAADLVHDPWAARDDYVALLLDRSKERVAAFLDRHARRDLSEAVQVRLFELLELQRHAMLMYTSCGWFFDELSGLETVQVLRYAGRVVQLARDALGLELEEGFLGHLQHARSNLPEFRDGRGVWERCVKPSMVDLRKVAGHVAVAFPFSPQQPRTAVYGFPVELLRWRLGEAGRARLGVGAARITEGTTGKSATFAFGVVYLGDHHVVAGLRDESPDAERFERELTEAFRIADLPRAIRLIDRHFTHTYSLSSLFWDEQRRILDEVLKDTLREAEATYRRFYDHHAPLMRYLVGLHQPLPASFRTAAELVLNAAIRRQLAGETPEKRMLEAELHEAKVLGVPLDTKGLGFAATAALRRALDAVIADPEDAAPLRRALDLVRFASQARLELDVWHAQNVWWRLRTEARPAQVARAQKRRGGRRWVEAFDALGIELGMAP
jgi:alpha-amylase/alpha-mannosidase (GH57 family)